MSKLYKVQTGAFLIKRNAEKQAGNIISKTGLKTIIVKENAFYKVQVGAFSNKANAENVIKTLSKSGFIAKIFEYNVADTKETSTQIPEIEEKVITSKIRVWFIHFFDENEKLYGDATAIIQYEDDGKTVKHCVLIDTAMKAASTVKKLKSAGVKTIDAVVISHAHGDHYGGLTKVFDNFQVNTLYLPDCTELDKYQKSYGNAIRNQAKKAQKRNIPYFYLTKGKGFTVGDIDCSCIYQLPASAVSEHDNHHYVNNESIVLVFTLGDKWRFHTAGDLQNDGNRALIKAVKNLKAHIFKCQWHGDANAANEAICEAVKPLVAVSNYHHKEGSGRGTTRKRLEKVGALVMRNAEDGDIYIDCIGDTMTVTCSKNKSKKKVFTL